MCFFADLVETPRGLITLGAQIFGGLEQRGIKSLQDCIKKCATAGSGIAPNHIPEELAQQVCFGIDYDFGSHKCYFHTDETLCPELTPTIPTPVQLVEAPSVVNILLCKCAKNAKLTKYSIHNSTIIFFVGPISSVTA